MTTQEAADELGVSRRQIQKYIETGTLKATLGAKRGTSHDYEVESEDLDAVRGLKPGRPKAKPIGYYDLSVGSFYITYHNVALPVDHLQGVISSGRFAWMGTSWDAEMVSEHSKRCSGCKQRLPSDSFAPDISKRGDKRDSRCRDCRSKQAVAGKKKSAG